MFNFVLYSTNNQSEERYGVKRRAHGCCNQFTVWTFAIKPAI